MGQLATRRERVVLELEDNFSSGMAKAAAATALLDKSLKGLSGSAVRQARTEMDSLGKSTDGVGRKADATGRQIDRLSGRLAIMARAAAALGPALVPIGASMVPVLSGVATQLTLTAGAAATAALAFNGIGDALGALNDYQLDPSVANFEALREELDRIGPAGEHFVRFLDQMGPYLTQLQNTAREGMFSGVEEGLTSLIDLAPQANRIVREMAEAMGGLAADAGAGLAGPAFRDFFDYLESDARPILTQMGHTVGNFATGLADMLVAFSPLTDDFSSGMERMSASFREWADGLSDSESFQSFLAYVRRSGPQVLDLLGSLADLFVSIAEAAAPVGEVVLPALTAMADILATIAASPAGEAFFTMAAALSAYRLAADAAAASSARMSAAMGRMNGRQMAAGIGIAAAALTDFDEQMGVSNTVMLGMMGMMAGPWGAAAGAAAGAVLDLSAAHDDLARAVEQVDSVIATGSIEQMRRSLELLRPELEWWNDIEGSGFLNGIASLPGVYQRAAAGISESGVRNAINDIEIAISNANSDGGARLLGQGLGFLGDQMRIAAGDAEALSGALSDLAGWLDRRAAVRGYRDSIAALSESLKAGFSREMVENLDAVGRSIIQVAENIKNPGARAEFIDGAITSLNKLAEGAGPKASAEIDKLIRRLDVLNGTKANPKVEVDNKPAIQGIEDARRAANRWGTGRWTGRLDADKKPADSAFAALFRTSSEYERSNPSTSVSADVGQALGALGSVRATLANIVDKTITVRVNQVMSGAGNLWSSGGFTGPGDKYEPAGVVHKGEVVIPQEYVRRDWSMLKARYGDLPGFADGGVVGNYTIPDLRSRRSLDDQLEIARIMQQIRQLTRDLRRDGKDRLEGLNRKIAELELKRAQKELRLAQNREEREARQEAREEAREKAREQRQEARETRANIRQIGEGLSFDGLLPPEELTFSQQMRAEIADFKQQILDAGGVWDKSMREWARDQMTLAHEYQAVSEALDREVAKRDALVAELDDQQARLADLTRTMESYAASVASNFLSNPFNQSRTETVPGAPGAASAALASAQAQLAAIRSSATGDSVGAAAEASRLIAQIASLEAAAAAEMAPTERVVEGVEALRESLERDIEQANRMTAALEMLAAKGLDTSGELGLLYQQLAASGDVVTAEQLAALSEAQIDEYERLFAHREKVAAELGALATQAVYGEQHAVLLEQIGVQNALIEAQNAAIVALNAELVTIGADVQAGAAAGVAGLQAQIAAITASIQSQPRQQAEHKKKNRV